MLAQPAAKLLIQNRGANQCRNSGLQHIPQYILGIIQGEKDMETTGIAGFYRGYIGFIGYILGII